MSGKTTPRPAPLSAHRHRDPRDHQRNCNKTLHEHILRLFLITEVRDFCFRSENTI
jgi:hypothetical protein